MTGVMLQNSLLGLLYDRANEFAALIKADHEYTTSRDGKVISHHAWGAPLRIYVAPNSAQIAWLMFFIMFDSFSIDFCDSVFCSNNSSATQPHRRLLCFCSQVQLAIIKKQLP